MSGGTLPSLWAAVQLTGKIYAACSLGHMVPTPVTVAVAVPVPVPVPGVDVPAVLQSPSASLNKITYNTACDELLPFLQLTSALSSAKAFNKRSTAIKSHPSPLTANEIK